MLWIVSNGFRKVEILEKYLLQHDVVIFQIVTSIFISMSLFTQVRLIYKVTSGVRADYTQGKIDIVIKWIVWVLKEKTSPFTSVLDITLFFHIWALSNIILQRLACIDHTEKIPLSSEFSFTNKRGAFEEDHKT